MKNKKLKNKKKINRIFYIEDIIEYLKFFWKYKYKYSCSIIEPFPSEKTAGTVNLESFLFLTKNEKKNICFVDRCLRINDGIYSENGTRSLRHYQLQVLLNNYNYEDMKKVYIDSLKFINIETNDIKFYNDNWQHLSFGAKGTGFEVHCNNIEITQLTKFKKFANHNLKINTFEIAYGIERIAMIIQKKNNIFDLEWNCFYKYRDLNYITEKHSFSFFKNNYKNKKVIFKFINEQIEKIEIYFKNKFFIEIFKIINNISDYINIAKLNNLIDIVEEKKIISILSNYSEKLYDKFQEEINDKK